MVPIVTQLAADFDGRALVGTVDTTEQTQLSQSYGVTAVPTFVFFKGSREVSRQVGTTTYADLAARLNGLITTGRGQSVTRKKDRKTGSAPRKTSAR